MTYLTTGQVQQWLEQTKLVVEAIDLDLEKTVIDRVIGRLSTKYNTSSWVDEATTPSLVLQAASMLYASIAYNKAYSEDSETSNWWADKLELWSTELVEGSLLGVIDVEDLEEIDSTSGQPSFWPNATTGVADPASAAKFTMAMEF